MMSTNKLSIASAIFMLLVACSLISAIELSPLDKESDAILQKRLKELLEVNSDRDSLNDDELFNKLFPYETIAYKTPQTPSSSRRSNSILHQSQSSRSLDRELDTSVPITKKDLKKDDEPMIINAKEDNEQQNSQESSTEPKVSSSIQQEPERPSLSKSAIDVNKAKSVAFNSREVRLMGPEKLEVEMKDDLATKVAVVFDNLRQETGQFLDQVNVKLDKGWNDFKQSVDKLVEQGKKQVSQL